MLRIKDHGALLALLRLIPRRALEASRTTNVIESMFATVCHRTRALQGMPLQQDCARDDLQARRARGEKLASVRRIGHNQLSKVILGVKFTDGIEVVSPCSRTAA